MVIWFVGISGAGKTTLGNKLKAYLDAKNQKSFLIDGDVVRDFYDNDLGFSKEDRRANIKRILFSVYVLEKNGIIPIVCNISPFEDLRVLARKKFNNYHEIYLHKDIQKAMQNDIKGIYQKHLLQTSLVGIDLVFEEPMKSDLVLEVDNEDIETSFRSIIRYFEEKVKIK